MTLSNYLVSWVVTYLGDLQPTYIEVIIYLLSSMDIPVLDYQIIDNGLILKSRLAKRGQVIFTEVKKITSTHHPQKSRSQNCQGDMNNKCPLYKVYMGLIFTGTPTMFPMNQYGQDF